MNAPFLIPASEACSFRPRRLLSLLEMLEKYSSEFYLVMASLEAARCRIWSLRGDYPSGLLPHDSPHSEELRHLLRMAATYCAEFKFISICTELQRMQAATRTTQPIEVLLANLRSTSQRIYDELKAHKFHYVSPEYTALAEQPCPFGDEVAEKMPTLSFDIEEAAKCLALERWTGAVFHLMRVMELCVQKLGQKLKIKINPREETWYQITAHVDKVINSLPSKTSAQKAKKARLAAASAHLNAVRIAWRNEVMHPKTTYTEQEAKEIYSHVQTFVKDVVQLL